MDVRFVNVPVRARPAVITDCPDGMNMLIEDETD